HLTVRSWRNNLLLEKSRILESLARKIGEENHLEIEIEWLQEFKANENKDEVVNDIRKAAKSLGLQIIERETPMKWGEDFGLFTEHYEGAMFGLGSGENQAALHNPDFDFPDELIETGSLIFEKIVREYLNS
ncbi:MAG TPA: M20/M25/M40 family metallo-hydrolase, partial [Arachidicoccus soli]|nr:M20/M25/M40 family metallo-hydrolase [Arachidicoccus soli]